MKKKIRLLAPIMVAMCMSTSVAYAAVNITKAEWEQDGQRLSLRAEEGHGSAELTAVYGGQSYSLKYDDDDHRYELRLRDVCFSKTVTITSSTGASATHTVREDGDGSRYECAVISALSDDEENSQSTTISITRASWDEDNQKLSIRAEEGRGSAELTAVYGGQSYTLQYDNDHERYELKLEPVCFSNTITITSSTGASTSHDVEARDGDGSGYECTGTIEPPPVCLDSDNDGFTDAACGGTDCNDNNAAINPGASEVCGDGVDQDCSGADLLCPPPATGSHAFITSYDGPSTCIGCHSSSAYDMLDSLHMQWSGSTPNLTNTNGESLGKGVNGINTFCTYAMSSGGACFGCHVRSDGNAPHAPGVNDVDCLMCHNDTYQRMTVADLSKPTTVVDYLGNEKTYFFGEQDADGNYTNVPNYDAMPAGTTMLQLAQNVHLPTRISCLRCHAKAGGGDWTKRGDMGLSTMNPVITEDVHMSPAGADLSCQACHATEGGHKVGGRGIDLRETEAVTPTCQNCHTAAPHSDSTLNRHAQGQVSCQVCHIRSFGKGGATEMSRDWLAPHWNPAFCNGQGGYVGEETKVANVKPEYTWFDGTSYVYNVGEQISPNANGIYIMAKANGKAFDGKSKIVPIKRHLTNTALHESGQIIAPKIMDMFMTGDFDQAVQAGMADQGLTGNYTMVEAEAEMLITHGVDPKSNTPLCSDCHDGSGQTPDGSKILPFGSLGYQTFPSSNMCSLCHSSRSANWDSMHSTHVDGRNMDCADCHTTPPTGLTSARTSLCSSCHSYESTTDFQSIHSRHLSKNIACKTCHTF